MSILRRAFIYITLFTLLIIPDSASAQSEYIRLHILADTDSVSDQVLKLCVRDDIREYARQLLSNCADSESAWRTLSASQDQLLNTVQESAARYGFRGETALEMGVYHFPDRIYGDELVPAGDYRALRITLGSGQGRNWWCVVYPSLCLPEDADTDRPVEFYSSVWRWLIRIKEAFFS